MKTVDVFCGAGGLSLGFMRSGYSIELALDYWEKAIDTYKKNFTHTAIKQDLSDIENSIKLIKEYSPEVIIGGPPCQDFSQAGKRSEGGRASLTQAFAAIVSDVLPKAFVMENVDRAAGSSAYHSARNLLKKAGYGLTEITLNAALCGAPQRRKRFFCIGIIGENDGFLIKKLTSSLRENPMTVREYCGEKLGLNHYYRHPRNYERRGIFSIDEPAPTIRGVNRPVPPNYRIHHGDSTSPEKVRPLTLQERALLQTFPENFIWPETKTDAEQMVGNAVPAELARYVAEKLKSYLDG